MTKALKEQMPMKPESMRTTLAETLEDRRLSRSEKKALSRILDHVEPTPQELGVYRHFAFELASERLSGPDSNSPKDVRMVLEWLEDVNKLLLPPCINSEGVFSEAYFSPSEACPHRIAGLIRSATNTVDIAVFTVTDDRISDAILEAHRGGTQVRIVTDDDKSGDYGSDVLRLRDAGVPVRMDRTRHHMHHKFAIFDGIRLLTGSYNWTRSAANKNEENFIITGDEQLIGEFAAVFEALWKEYE